MLSKGAFNALLKTLEEPPEHVKFIFATTEIRKVPVTVLSRCQRFDLRRVDVPVLVAHFEAHRRQRRRHGRGRRAGADRPRGRRLGARRPVAARSGDRHGRGRGARRDGARHARPRRPRAHLRSARACVRRRRQGGAAVARRPASRRRRAGAAARRSRRGRAHGDARQGRRRRSRQRRPERRGDGARARRSPSGCRRRCCRAPGRCCSRACEETAQGAQPARRRRDGADPPRLYGRPAGARRDHPRSAAAARGPSGAKRRAHRRAAQRPAARSLRSASAAGAREPGSSEDDIGRAGSGRRAAVRRSRASFAEVVALAASAARPSSRCIWKSTSAWCSFDAGAGTIDLYLLPGAPQQLANELREKLNAWTGRRWMVVLSKAPGEPTIGEAQARARGGRASRHRETPGGGGHPAAVSRGPGHEPCDR